MESQRSTERALRSDAQQSRAALLKAARELVSERGLEALTVVAVAQRAGLHRSTAYQHFKSREQLLAAVGGEFARELRRLFREPRDFGAQIDFFVDYFREHPDIGRTWMFWLLAGSGEMPRGWADYVGSLERLAASPRSQDGIDAEMLGLIGMSSALVWSLVGQSDTSARFARELKRLFLYGALRPARWPELAAELERGE